MFSRVSSRYQDGGATMNRRQFLQFLTAFAAAIGFPLPATGEPETTASVEAVAPTIGKWTTPQTWTSGELITTETLDVAMPLDTDTYWRLVRVGERMAVGSIV